MRKVVVVWGVVVSSVVYAEKIPMYQLEKIVVTATKSEQLQREIGTSVTVISEEELERRGEVFLLDTLKNTLGITMMQNGILGGTSFAYIRGAKPSYTLVLLDGIELNDPMDVERGFNFAHFLTRGFERIEIVRGAQSTLYGSDATAGVINLIPKEGESGYKPEFLFEIGSHSTFREGLTLGGREEQFNYFLSLSCLHSQGISKSSGGSERDSYGNISVLSKLSYNIFDSSKISFVTYFADTDTDIDDGACEDDPNHTSKSRNASFKIQLEQEVFDWWDYKFFFTYNRIRRKYQDEEDKVDYDEYSTSWYKGNTNKIEWQNNFYFTPAQILTMGVEFEEERGASYYYSKSTWGKYESKIDRKKVGNRGVYVQHQLKLKERLFFRSGIRMDDNELFEEETTYSLSLLYFFPQTFTRLKANWGTGFKTPSLYQLYSSYGDAELEPEVSRSYDWGIEQTFWEGRFNFEVIYFHNKFKEMIEFDSVSSKYKNLGKVKTEGVEAKVKFLFSEGISIQANFTYLDTLDKTTGLKLLRRPKRTYNFDIFWKLWKNSSLNVKVSYVGKREDINYTVYPPQRVEQDAYFITDLFYKYKFNDDLEIFVRVENLFNRDYQPVYGYTGRNRAFYMGTKIIF